MRRLPVYHHLLQEMMLTGVPNVSCTAIAAALNLDSTQVRKDIEATGIVGKPKVGYSLVVLARWIENFLGWNNINEAFSGRSRQPGQRTARVTRSSASWDSTLSPASTPIRYKVGHSIAGKEVLHLDNLVDLARSMHIHLGVIATPSAAAQKVADSDGGGRHPGDMELRSGPPARSRIRDPPK